MFKRNTNWWTSQVEPARAACWFFQPCETKQEDNKQTASNQVLKNIKTETFKKDDKNVSWGFFFYLNYCASTSKGKISREKRCLKRRVRVFLRFSCFFFLFLFFFSFQINHPLRNKKCCYRWENYWNKLCLRVFLTEAACKNLNDPVIRTGSKLEKSCISFKIACGLSSAWFLLSKETCRRVFSLRPRERWEAFWYNKVRKKKVILKVNEFILAMNMRWSFK